MTFTLTEADMKKVQKFAKIQDKKSKGRGTYSYIFTPTGIGCSVIVKNNDTFATLDISDYEHW